MCAVATLFPGASQPAHIIYIYIYILNAGSTTGEFVVRVDFEIGGQPKYI